MITKRKMNDLNEGVKAVYVDFQDTLVDSKKYLLGAFSTIIRHTYRPKNIKELTEELKTWKKALKIGLIYRKMDYKDRVNSLLELCEGRDVKIVKWFGRVLSKYINPNVKKRLLNYQEKDVPIFLVSGDPRTVVEPVVRKLYDSGLKFKGHILNDLVLEGNKITKKIQSYSSGVNFQKVIDGPNRKLNALQEIISHLNISGSDVECINDEDSLEALVDDYILSEGGHIVKGYQL